MIVRIRWWYKMGDADIGRWTDGQLVVDEMARKMTTPCKYELIEIPKNDTPENDKDFYFHEDYILRN